MMSTNNEITDSMVTFEEVEVQEPQSIPETEGAVESTTGEVVEPGAEEVMTEIVTEEVSETVESESIETEISADQERTASSNEISGSSIESGYSTSSVENGTLIETISYQTEVMQQGFLGIAFTSGLIIGILLILGFGIFLRRI